jgi:hypothetical protein
MSQEQIFASLDEMLANPKSKNFLNHLVRSYVPFTKVQKVWDKPKGDFKCVLTRTPLISVAEVMQGMQTEEYKADFMKSLKSIFDDNAKHENPVVKLLGDKTLGLTGKDTTTFMSFSAYQGFMDWVITKSLNGDKHINWLLGSIRRDSFLKRAENIQDEGVQKKVQQIVKQKQTTTTYSMGDASDVLAKLKAKMEGQ